MKSPPLKETVRELIAALQDQPAVAAEVIEALMRGFGRRLQERFDSEFGQGAWSEGEGIEVKRVYSVFAAACAWRDSPLVDRRFLAGVANPQETRLIDAIEAARDARKQGSS